jgi:cell wall-associated NlpC family hydrolase
MDGNRDVLDRLDISTDEVRVRVRRSVVGLISVVATVALTTSVADASDSVPTQKPTPAQLQQLDADNLAAAADALVQQALSSGALKSGPNYWSPAKVALAAVNALTRQAIKADPSLKPTDTTAIMGPVPGVIAHHLRKRPHHVHISRTRTLTPFSSAIPDSGSSGIGHNRRHDGAKPAPFQPANGDLVDPVLERAKPPTVGLVAVRAALKKLGQPYVWGGAGPTTFDCSGLVQWAYAHAGVPLVHHAADQWNQGRLIPGRDMLPGDLIMFGHPIFHVGIYLGAGWMINAPYTGQYVNLVQVPSPVTGVIRP